MDRLEAADANGFMREALDAGGQGRKAEVESEKKRGR